MPEVAARYHTKAVVAHAHHVDIAVFLPFTGRNGSAYHGACARADRWHCATDRSNAARVRRYCSRTLMPVMTSRQWFQRLLPACAVSHSTTKPCLTPTGPCRDQRSFASICELAQYRLAMVIEAGILLSRNQSQLVGAGTAEVQIIKRKFGARRKASEIGDGARRVVVSGGLNGYIGFTDRRRATGMPHITDVCFRTVYQRISPLRCVVVAITCVSRLRCRY